MLCYFFRALRDADKAINIASDWPKGYFRKGRALAGLKVRWYIYSASFLSPTMRFECSKPALREHSICIPDLLFYLQLYADAEQAFMQVLKLDRNCEDAMTELLRVRTYQLTVSHY